MTLIEAAMAVAIVSLIGSLFLLVIFVAYKDSEHMTAVRACRSYHALVTFEGYKSFLQYAHTEEPQCPN